MGKVAAVSSLGRFRSTKGVVSTPKPSSKGYVSVKIHKKSYYLHRLSAFAFQLPRKEKQDYVNHINGNPSNNKRENLEWCDHPESYPSTVEYDWYQPKKEDRKEEWTSCSKCATRGSVPTTQCG